MSGILWRSIAQLPTCPSTRPTPTMRPYGTRTSSLSNGRRRARRRSGLRSISSRSSWAGGSRTYEVVDFAPGRCLTMRTAGAPFPMETTYTWDDENGHADDASEPRHAERIFCLACACHVLHGCTSEQERLSATQAYVSKEAVRDRPLPSGEPSERAALAVEAACLGDTDEPGSVAAGDPWPSAPGGGFWSSTIIVTGRYVGVDAGARGPRRPRRLWRSWCDRCRRDVPPRADFHGHRDAGFERLRSDATGPRESVGQPRPSDCRHRWAPERPCAVPVSRLPRNIS